MYYVCTTATGDLPLTKRSLKEYVYVGDFGPTAVAIVLVILWVATMNQFGFSPIELLKLGKDSPFSIPGLMGWTSLAMIPMMIGLMIWTINGRLTIARLAGTR